MSKDFYWFRGSAGLEGAYNVKDIVIPFLTSEVGKRYHDNSYKILDNKLTSLLKPGLATLATAAYSIYGPAPF